MLVFDEKANQEKAINMIMDDGMYGFSNHDVDQNKLPTLTVFDLNYHKEGLMKLFQGLAERECLIVRISLEQICNANCIILHDKLLRKIIEK